VADLKVNVELLNQFEKGLDPRFPEKSAVPARVLGYGEISTVLEIGAGSERELAYKRLPMFKTEEEAESYTSLHREYVDVLADRVGLRVVPSVMVRLPDQRKGRVVVYIAQQKLPREAIAHQAIHQISADDVRNLVLAVLRETKKVFGFNGEHGGKLEVGFDGQISNWGIVGFDSKVPRVSEEPELVYFDTSTPLMRKSGQEQLDPELFLRSAPSFMVWLLRLLFLEDVMTRYYDLRRVVVDLIANFYKEQRPDLIPGLVEAINGFFSAEIQEGEFQPITVKEVASYYREDAWIWRLYLVFRKIDRSLHRLLGKDYPYVLPGRIKR
jgi:hypothetical protein